MAVFLLFFRFVRVLTLALAAVYLTANAALAADAATTATLNGVVRTGAGAPVPGAAVTANGPQHSTASTDANGGFTLTLTPGVYTITVTKPGFNTASTPDVALAAGDSTPLNVTLVEANLTSLRTIGYVQVGRRGASTINTGAANQTVMSGAEFQDLANPQINDVLQRIPDVVVQKLGTQQDTSIVVGGLQPYETQVLLDGHPLALGQYGIWLSQYFPSYMVGNVETQSGPGNTTPFANLAVGGTVNLQTIGFTKKQTAELNLGIDNYGSSYSNVIATGSAEKLSYAASLGVSGENGYYQGKKECDTYVTDPNTTVNSPNSAAIVAFCGDFSGSQFTRAEMLKLKYDFSPSTSFDFGVLASAGGYEPQGSAWGASFGPTLVEGCIPNTQICTNPADANLIGKTVNGLTWFPGSRVLSNQQIFTGNLRTTIGTGTLLVRPYLGTILPETYDGTGEGQFPAFFGPAPGTAGYQPPSLAPGQQIPAGGLPDPNTFESTYCPPGTVNSFNQINSPHNTITSVNGQEECYQYPYSTFEIDKLYGNTLSFVQPIQAGAGFLDFTYDFHGQSTFAYANTPSNVQVPDSSTRYSTFSLTGNLKPTEKLGVGFGVYQTAWTVTGEQPTFDASGTPTGITGLQRTVSRIDPHLALTYRADRDTSFRAAVGTSDTYPFVGDVSGGAAEQPPAFTYTAGIVTEKNANLQPEQSIAYDLGADHRFGNGSVLSVDLQDTIVHDVFQQLTTQETVTLNGQSAILGIFTPINVARLEAQLLTAKYRYQPAKGFGVSVALTADSSVLSGIPVVAYNGSPSLPADNVQVCGNAQFTPGLATCIPYIKGYGEVSWQSLGGARVALGVDYEGKNNAYYQPPFAILDLTAHAPVARYVDLNFGVENLLNTNSYNYLPAPNLGVAAVGDFTTDGKTIQQGSYPTYRIPAPTRTLRASLRLHFGR